VSINRRISWSGGESLKQKHKIGRKNEKQIHSASQTLPIIILVNLKHPAQMCVAFSAQDISEIR